MRETLRTWIADADARHSVASFGLGELLPELAYQNERTFDLYSALVGELFDLLRIAADDSRDWATVGSGLALVGMDMTGANRSDAYFFASAAYYLGGFSASAYLTMRQANPEHLSSDSYRACFDLMARPTNATSDQVRLLLDALRRGSSTAISELGDVSGRAVEVALLEDPDAWVSARILASLLERFSRTNVRAALPEGDAERWDALVNSFLDRRPAPVWDFFPSQLEALDAGLLTTDRSFSLQMPTGAGKTALTETLIYDRLVDEPRLLAVLLVPFRSLAYELRNSLGRRLTEMGLPTRSVYGGTVPTPEESQDLDEVRTIIATPEAMTGLLDSAPELLQRLSLVVCDEGHLLDSTGRGVGLELLLARFLAREVPPRVVFVSAIVPNIEEVNAWLGGDDQTVVRSEFRPADAEYAVLRPDGGSGRALRLGLEMRAPSGTNLPTRTVPGFLSVDDFEYFYEPTGRTRTWPFGSIKTQTVATARKSLRLGTVAVFATTKTGNQGILALAEELVEQLEQPLRLPSPNDFVTDTGAARVADVVDYLSREYGHDWTGTVALTAGAVVHHGDIPQETREALEELLRSQVVRLVFCTSTLAEGVDLPIRTLVLYSTSRRGRDGVQTPMLARDVKNLVGRAGRAGISTKGLVICANENQWDAIARVADGAPSEPVAGALRALVERLANALRENNLTLSNQILEVNDALHPLVDGIDATLMEFIYDDLGPAEFQRVATTIADRTYAYRQVDHSTRELLENVFSLRAERLLSLRENGRLGWAAGTGAKARLLDSVIDQLIPAFERWQAVESPQDVALLGAFVDWARQRSEFQRALREAYPDAEINPSTGLPDREDFLTQVRLWLTGVSFSDASIETGREISELLRIHSRTVSYVFTTLVEQAVAVIESYFRDGDLPLASAVVLLPDYLRHGVPTQAARNLLVSGVRHRRAAILLGEDPAMGSFESLLSEPSEVAAAILEANPEEWRVALGDFVFSRTARDVGASLDAG